MNKGNNMKKYLKEIIILLLQIFIFYILPLLAGPADTMGLIVLIIITTFILSLILGIISKERIKYIYPIIISIIFIPTIFIYYNNSAMIYILWFLIDSYIGLIIGIIISIVINKIRK